MTIPALTATQMTEIDRVMAEEFGVETMQLMEVAGRAVAAFARRRFLAGDARGKRIVLLCGSGGNGGDGMVAARYLFAWGGRPEVWLGRRPVPGKGIAAHQLAILERLGIPIHEPTTSPALPATDLVVDALLGFGLAGPPDGETASLIAAANTQTAPILAVDLPSGLDATSGIVAGPCIRADATLTLALPKTGLLVPAAREVAGELSVADIGVPPVAYARIGVEVGAPFGTAAVVRLDEHRSADETAYSWTQTRVPKGAQS
jgi:NAD(P)H-hydrate epimerase